MNEIIASPQIGQFLWSALMTTVGVLGLLACEKKDFQIGRWLFKPMAALGFVGAALVLEPWRSSYGIAVTIGLVLSVVGDLCLVPRGAGKVFKIGVVAFLLAHLAYAFAFMAIGYSLIWSGIAFFPLAFVGVLVYRWLLPGVPEELRQPVLVYIMVITWMVAMSVGSFAAQPTYWLIPVAAIMFWASDISVARGRFMNADFSNKAWGIPMYFGAQLLFALTTLFGARPV